MCSLAQAARPGLLQSLMSQGAQDLRPDTRKVPFVNVSKACPYVFQGPANEDEPTSQYAKRRRTEEEASTYFNPRMAYLHV